MQKYDPTLVKYISLTGYKPEFDLRINYYKIKIMIIKAL